MHIQCDRTLANKTPLPSRSFDYHAPPAAYPSASVEGYPSASVEGYPSASVEAYLSASVDETPARPSRGFKAIKQRWPYVIIGISAASTLVWIGLLIGLAVTYAIELI
jgi:hypothetical protein